MSATFAGRSRQISGMIIVTGGVIPERYPWSGSVLTTVNYFLSFLVTKEFMQKCCVPYLHAIFQKDSWISSAENRTFPSGVQNELIYHRRCHSDGSECVQHSEGCGLPILTIESVQKFEKEGHLSA